MTSLLCGLLIDNLKMQHIAQYCVNYISQLDSIVYVNNMTCDKFDKCNISWSCFVSLSYQQFRKNGRN